MKLRFQDKNNIYTDITVDYKANKVDIINYTDELILRAFGCNEHPTIKDFEDFLESRCLPKTKHKLKMHLDSLGVDYYDPYLIVKKTNGRISDDDFFITFLD